MISEKRRKSYLAAYGVIALALISVWISSFVFHGK